MRQVDQEPESPLGTHLQFQRGTMSIGHTEIRVRGKAVPVPSAQIDGRKVITVGKWLKIAAVQKEKLVDDDLPSSRKFLRLYKRNVKSFRSLYVPHILSYALCYLWEKYATWSAEQLPPAFNRWKWHAY